MHCDIIIKPLKIMKESEKWKSIKIFKVLEIANRDRLNAKKIIEKYWLDFDFAFSGNKENVGENVLERILTKTETEFSLGDFLLNLRLDRGGQGATLINNLGGSVLLPKPLFSEGNLELIKLIESTNLKRLTERCLNNPSDFKVYKPVLGFQNLNGIVRLMDYGYKEE